MPGHPCCGLRSRTDCALCMCSACMCPRARRRCCARRSSASRKPTSAALPSATPSASPSSPPPARARSGHALNRAPQSSRAAGTALAVRLPAQPLSTTRSSSLSGGAARLPRRVAFACCMRGCGQARPGAARRGTAVHRRLPLEKRRGTRRGLPSRCCAGSRLTRPPVVIQPASAAALFTSGQFLAVK